MTHSVQGKTSIPASLWVQHNPVTIPLSVVHKHVTSEWANSSCKAFLLHWSQTPTGATFIIRSAWLNSTIYCCVQKFVYEWWNARNETEWAQNMHRVWVWNIQGVGSRSASVHTEVHVACKVFRSYKQVYSCALVLQAPFGCSCFPCSSEANEHLMFAGTFGRKGGRSGKEQGRCTRNVPPKGSNRAFVKHSHNQRFSVDYAQISMVAFRILWLNPYPALLRWSLPDVSDWERTLTRWR